MKYIIHIKKEEGGLARKIFFRWYSKAVSITSEQIKHFIKFCYEIQ